MAILHKFTGEEVIATELPQLLNQNFDYVNDNRIKTVNNVEYDDNNNIDVTHLVSQSIVSGTDLNNLTTSGEYVRLGSVTKLLNSPSDHPFFLTILASDGLVKQVLTELIVNNPATFTRTMNGTQWSPWIGLTYATQAEAEEGVDNTKVMTPLRTAQEIEAKAFTKNDIIPIAKGGTDATTANGARLNLKTRIMSFDSFALLGLGETTVTLQTLYQAFKNVQSTEGSSAAMFLMCNIATNVVTGLGLPANLSGILFVKHFNDRTQLEFFVDNGLIYTAKYGSDGKTFGWNKSLLNSDIATQAEAEAGINNTKVMTPLSTKQLGDKNYLKLSGGTITGNLNFSKVLKQTNDEEIYIVGATDASNGAGLWLAGNDFSGTVPAGAFRLQVHNKETGAWYNLTGKPDGTLTWNNKKLATQGALSMPSDNRITITAPSITANHGSVLSVSDFYTAPADGYFYIDTNMENINASLIRLESNVISTSSGSSGMNCRKTLCLPLSKGQSVTISYGNILSIKCYFCYSGSEV